MKTILCYGDSNTWGYMPWKEQPASTAKNRFPWGVRWTSRLQIDLGSEYRVIEAGLNGRTSVFEAPFEEHRSGIDHIDARLLEACPVDLVVLMLGTNDIKPYYAQPTYGIMLGIRRLVERIQNSGCGTNDDAPKILLVSPIRLNSTYKDGWLGEEFGSDALKKDAELARYIESVAREAGTYYLNASEHIEADPADGIHMNAEGHSKMADLIAQKIRIIV